MRLPSLAELERLPPERALVDLAFGSARERHTVVVELDDGVGRLAGHIVDRVLET